MILSYSHSIILPCYCQAHKILSKGVKLDELPKIRCDNSDKTLNGKIIEKVFNYDEDGYEHVKTVIHCLKCK
jgi:hypothetical protein